MLDDRHYMRPEYRPGPSLRFTMSACMALIVSLVVTFFVQYSYPRFFETYFALSLTGLKHGYVWQLLTFQFLHGGPTHLIFNGFSLWCFGRYVEERLGVARFLTVYFLSGVAGGLLQVLLAFIFPSHFGGSILGASAGICGLIAIFAMLEPDGVIMAYFVLPIRAKWLLYLDIGIALVNTLYAFFHVDPTPVRIADAAHLGGILFSLGYLRWGMNLSHTFADWNPLQRKLRRERMIKAATVRPPLSKLRRRPQAEKSVEFESEEFISKEVDPILDKISAQGIQSLTDRERAILQAARAKMSKR